MLPKIVPFMR